MSRTRKAAFTVLVLASAVAAAAAPGEASADTVLAQAAAHDLAISGESLFWSRKESRSRYRLMMLRGGAVTRLPLRPDVFPLRPSAGTDAAGAPVLVYSRCRRTDSCRALYSFSLGDGRERRLPVKAGHGCELLAPSIDHGALAFARYGKCADRGVWLRQADGRLKRFTRRADVCCTAVVGDAAAWVGASTPGVVHLVVAPANGQPFELFRSDDTYPLDAYIGNLNASGGMLYWSVSTWRGRRARVATDARVYRASLTRFADCEATNRELPTRPQDTVIFAVADTGLHYASRDKILVADAPPLVFGLDHSPFASLNASTGRGCWMG